MASLLRSTVQENPFRGLEPYDEGKQIYGRDSDLILLKDRIFSYRTTLLFAASGAGKTSFLKAKVLPELGNAFCCFYHREWVGLDLQAVLVSKLAQTIGVAPAENVRLRELLIQFREQSAICPEGFLLILDQFEELFQSYAFHEQFENFIEELCELINDHTVRGRVIIAMRDDFLGELSIFDNRIPDLLNNYYHLRSPDEAQAREIIRKTVAEVRNASVSADRLKTLTAHLSTFTIGVIGKPVLAAQPSDEMASGQLQEQGKPEQKDPRWRRFKQALVRTGRAVRNLWRRWFAAPPKTDAGSAIVKRETVILPYLQIVCREIWEREWRNLAESKETEMRFLSSWNPIEESARIVLDNFCKKTLNALGSTRRKDVAARAFDFLMTREGAKLAYECRALAEHMGEDPKELYEILHRLALPETKILREYKRPDGSTWFELYHDMYATIVHDWKSGYQTRRAKERRGKLVGLGACAALALWLGIVLSNVIKFQFAIETATEPPFYAYDSMKGIPVWGPVLNRYANHLLAAYWDRRARVEGLHEDSARTLLFRLYGERLEDSPERRTEANRLISAFQGLQITFRTGTESEISAIAFSSDEKLLAVGTANGDVQVWDIANRQKISANQISDCTKRQTNGTSSKNKVEHFAPESQPDPIRELLFSVDRKRLAARTIGGQVQIWNLERSENKCLLSLADISAMTFASTGHEFAVASPSGAVEAFDDSMLDWFSVTLWPQAYSTEKQTALARLVFSPNSEKLFAADAANNVQVFNAGGTIGSVVVRKSKFAPAFSPDGRRMVVGVNSRAELWSLEGKSERRLAILDIKTDFLEGLSVSFSPDSKSVALVSIDADTRIFDTNKGVLMHPVENPLAFDVKLGTGGLLFFSSPTGLFEMQVPGNQISRPLPETGVLEQFSSSARLLAGGFTDGAVELWDIHEREMFDRPITFLSLSANGKMAAFQNSDGRIFIRDVLTGADVQSFQGTGLLSYASLSPDGSVLAGYSSDKHLNIWISGQHCHADRVPQDRIAVRYSPDGKLLLVTGGHSSRVFQITADSNARLLGEIPKTNVEFTPDSSGLLVLRSDHVEILKVVDFQPVFQLDVAANLPSVHAFGPEGLFAIFTGIPEKEIQVWDWRKNNLVFTAAEKEEPRSFVWRENHRQFLACFPGKLEFWDVELQKPFLKTLHVGSEADSTQAFFAELPNKGWRLEQNTYVWIISNRRVLQLWNLTDEKKAGEAVKLGSDAVAILRFRSIRSDETRLLISTSGSWLHLLGITSNGFSAQQNHFLGLLRSPHIIQSDGKELVSGISGQPGFRQVSVINLADVNAARPNVDLQKLTQEFETKLAFDTQGKPATLVSASGRRKEGTSSSDSTPP